MYLTVSILLPLFTILFLPLKQKSRIGFYLLTSCLALINLFILNYKISHSISDRVDWGFNICFAYDRYSWFFANLINLAWFITTIYSYSYVKYQFQQKAKIFHLHLSIILTTVLATTFAANLISIFIFYILSMPSIYRLIKIRPIEDNVAASKFYLLNTLAPSILIFLPAVIYFNYRAPNFHFGDSSPEFLTQEPITASLLLVAIIIGMSRNSIIPFHKWLPKTSRSPAPVCALVNSVAAIKLGAISLIKIVVYVYGLDLVHTLNSDFFHLGFLTYLCGLTAVLSSIKAYQAQDLKSRFSYSTVTQVSFIITAILIATPTSILGAILHIMTHSFAKICLFFIAGYYNCRFETVEIKKLIPILPSRKLLSFITTLCGFSIAGFPFLAGYLSKDLMLIEELHSGNYAAAIFLLFGSLVNIFYIIPIFKNSILKKPDPNIKIEAMPLNMKIAIALCICIIIYLSIYTYSIIRAFENF